MKKYILLAAAAIAMAGCTNDENLIDEPVAAQISATIGGSAVSRVNGNLWTNGDQIGITMGTKYTNMKYSTNGGGTFTGTPMYFNNKTDAVTISAYYPFTGTEGSNPGEITVTNTASSQANCDFLYAEPINVTGSNPDVELKFSHRMSKLTLTFINGDGMDDAYITSCTIGGLVLEGTFNPTTGVCKASETAAARSIDVTLPTPGYNNNVGTSHIVFPQTLQDKLTLKIQDSKNQNYACDLEIGGNTLLAGNDYQFTIKVNKTGLTVGEPSIANWTEIKGEDGEAKSDDSDD